MLRVSQYVQFKKKRKAGRAVLLCFTAQAPPSLFDFNASAHFVHVVALAVTSSAVRCRPRTSWTRACQRPDDVLPRPPAAPHRAAPHRAALHRVLQRRLPTRSSTRAASRRWLASTTSSSRKRQKTYGRSVASTAASKDADLFAADEDFNGSANPVSPQPSPQPSSPPAPLSNSPSTPRHLPPHIQDEVEEASAARRLSFSREQTTSAAVSARPSLLLGGAMPGSRVDPDAVGAAAPADAPDQQEQPSSPPSVSDDVRRMGLGRSSSPAKRSLSQRDDDDDDDDHYSTVIRSPSLTEHTPTKLQHQQQPPQQQQHVSPMPSRTKPVDWRPASRRAPSIDMLTEEHSAETALTSPSVASAAPTASTQVTPVAQSAVSDTPRPSYDEQVKQVKGLVESFHRSQHEGQEGFLVSYAWLTRVLARTSDGPDSTFDKSALEGDVGPVETADLLSSTLSPHSADLRDIHGNAFVPLKPGLTIGTDFEVFPGEAWSLIVGWYGLAQGSPVITRHLRNTAADSGLDNLIFEIYPPIFTLQKIASGTPQAEPAVQLVSSRSERFQAFLARAKAGVGIPVANKVRVWKIIETLAADSGVASGLVTPTMSREVSPTRQSAAAAATTPQLTVELSALNALAEGRDRELVEAKDETNNTKYNGSLTLSTLGFMERQTLVLEEAQDGDGKDTFASDQARVGPVNGHKSDALSVSNLSRTQASIDADRRSPTPGMMTRGRMAKKYRGKACIGLQNLGNTCYMNSALQCIRSVEELTLFFQADAYKADLNVSNPLGHKGSMAKAYAGLIAQFYESNSSFSPRAFRNLVGRCQPLFSGYGQQDSQEFLSFLIDALHEDLNRIQKKPYIENPDSDDKLVHDEEYVRQLGETYRLNHAKRNASVAMDLFTGFYKNTMVCPECDKVSVTFDPYAQVTLQIPVENSLQHMLQFAPLNGPPVDIDLEIDLNSSFKQVKEYVADRIPGLDSRCLIVAEEYNHKLYKIFDDREVLSEARIAEKDILWVFELDVPASNVTSRRQRQSYPMSGLGDGVPDMSSDMADFMAVPVLHRCDNNLTMSPTFVLLTRDDVQDQDKLLRKLLRKTQTMTTRDLNEDSSVPAATSEDNSPGHAKDESDAVMTNEEDASSDDPNVQARSVESEDDVVDVQMKDNRKPDDQVPIFLTDKVLQPDFPISESLRSMFEVRFLKGIREIIPMNVPSSGSVPRDAETLQSRIQRQEAFRRNSSPPSRAAVTQKEKNESADDTEDELAEADKADASGTATAAESSDEDDAIPPPIPRRAPTFTRKPIATNAQDEYLVRLGDCLVLDWNRDAHDGLFRGTKKSDMRGLYTNQERLRQQLPDPALEEKRERLSLRKKKGVSLQECFQETARSEILSEDNAWYCNRCKEMRRATKTLVLWTVPDILIVHLKRFNMQSRWRDKIDAKVDFPIEGLDLNGMVGLPEDKSLIYDLFAVDRHFGGLGGGHYTAVTKNFMDGKWYDYNDSSVSNVNPNVAVDRSAYLLFYKRRTDGPIGPPYLQELTGAAAESSTRSSSESGEGQRLGDPSSPNGSSNVSRAAGVTLPRPQSPGAQALGAAGGSARASQVKNVNHRALDSDLPPAYEDEGISMDDADRPLPSAELGAGDLRGYDNGFANSWSFANLDNGRLRPMTFSDNGLDRSINSDDETLGQDDSNSLGPGNGSPPDDRMRQFDDEFVMDDEDVLMHMQLPHQLTPESDGSGGAHVEHVSYKMREEAAAAAAAAATGAAPTGPTRTSTVEGEQDAPVHDIRVGSDGESEVE